MKMKRSRKVHESQLTQLQHSVDDTVDKQQQQQRIHTACKKMTILNVESFYSKQSCTTNFNKKQTSNRNYQQKKTLGMTISTRASILESVHIFAHRQTISRKSMSICRRNQWLNTVIIVFQIIQQCTFAFGTNVVATTPMQANWSYTTVGPINSTKGNGASWQTDSIFMRVAKRFSTGNELWDGIIRDCYGRPTFSCFQKNVYTYLNDAFNAEDVNVTQRLKFFKNNVDYDQFLEPTESALSKDMNDENNDHHVYPNVPTNEHLFHNEIPAVERSMAAETPIEEVTNALYDKTVKFAMTHNVEIKMPEIMFDGATIRLSPRSFEGNGIIAKLEIIPKQEVEARLAGKIIMKKIKKFLKSKILLSFIALLLIIKIIKVKLFWLLPIIIGVGAAKKLLLKFLLFLFPALTHLFKLCSYYQQTYHSTKFHHHHHLINHHHTIVPAWHHAEHSQIPEIIYTDPPKGHISSYLHGAPIHETYGPPPSHEHYEGGWESSGPGLGSDIFNSKYKFQAEQSAPGPVYVHPSRNGAVSQSTPGLTAAQIAAQYEPTRSEFPQQPQQQLSPELAAQLKEAIRRQAEQRIIAQQQKILENQPFVQDGQPLVTKNYDPFYSPILIKIDKITEQLGVKDDFCKERLICSMYKEPTRYSPHSNFVSAELSRDPSELQPISDPEHPAVIRFYQYIQAALEGQEQKNCHQLYPQCNINTE